MRAASVGEERSSTGLQLQLIKLMVVLSAHTNCCSRCCSLLLLLLFCSCCRTARAGPALRAFKMDKLSMSLDDISKARSKAGKAKPAAAAGGGGAGPARRGGRKERQAAAAPLARPAVAPAAAAPAALICNNCGGRGHYARSCPSVAVASAPPVAAAGACFGCGGPRKFRSKWCGSVANV